MILTEWYFIKAFIICSLNILRIVDRTKSGKVDFKNEFAAKHSAPRISNNQKMDITFIVDESSIELFADDGLSVINRNLFSRQAIQSYSN